MKKLIFVAGAPGSGKSTICGLLRKRLQGYLIEFSDLREWHLDREWKNESEKEEKMAFENLVFILRNYIKNGYENVIVTDLKDSKVQELQNHFKPEEYIIVSLIVGDDEEIKRRVVERNSGYKNDKAAIEWNRNLKLRPALSNEFKIDNSGSDPGPAVNEIVKLI
ncbi:MAG: AAA family ATPase [Candidatus Firestonebacteria bacterium]